MVGKFQTGKIGVFFRNLDACNSRHHKKRNAVPRKNVGLWLEIVLFGQGSSIEEGITTELILLERAFVHHAFSMTDDKISLLLSL